MSAAVQIDGTIRYNDTTSTFSAVPGEEHLTGDATDVTGAHAIILRAMVKAANGAAAAMEAEAAGAPQAYRIEPGYEEQARPLTTRQIAVLDALHANMQMPVPFDVLPPVRGNDDITASAEWEGSSRFLIEVDPEGFVDRVAVRYHVAGQTQWAELGRNDRSTFLYDRVKMVAREGRRTVPAADNAYITDETK